MQVRLEQARRLATGSGKDQDAVAAYERRLFFGRCRVLCCLLGFTFMNGLARRSLSASGPSLVAEGLIGYPYIESIFMIGFEVFAMGKPAGGRSGGGPRAACTGPPGAPGAGGSKRPRPPPRTPECRLRRPALPARASRDLSPASAQASCSQCRRS